MATRYKTQKTAPPPPPPPTPTHAHTHHSQESQESGTWVLEAGGVKIKKFIGLGVHTDTAVDPQT